MIKILFFIPGLSEGGAEKVLRNLVNNLDQSKFDVTVQTIDQCASSEFLTNGIHYKAINRCKSELGKKIFSYCFRICAQLKLAYRFFVKDDYDIEVAYLETVATKIIAQSNNSRAKKVAWVHCDLARKEGIREVSAKVKKQYDQFDHIVCVSEDVRTGFHELFGPEFDTSVLPNVIDDDEIRAKSYEVIQYEMEKNKIQMVALGRLAQQKNFAYLIDTCRKLKDANCSFCLNILGEGPEREKLERQILSLGLEENVILRGFFKNPYPWVKRADIVVCSSAYEGISTVIQEALFLHKPVVTTPCTGMKELLGDSEYGMVVDNSNDGLLKGLYQMINSEELRSHYSQKAVERSKMLAKTAAVKLTQNFFESIVLRKI